MNKGYSQREVQRYLLWTFGLAWLIQIVAAIIYHMGNTLLVQLLLSIMMFTPLFGVLLTKRHLKGLGWKFHFRGNVKVFLIAWFVPTLLTILGAILYFLIFPQHFDLSGQYLIVNNGEGSLSQLQAKGISYSLLVLINVFTCLTYGPLINIVLTIGEEVGWRGFLYPQLKIKYGKNKGRLLGGIIWGVWHWPIIGLIGYEYGVNYIGFPIVGMLIFCIFTVAFGILCDWLYEKSSSIWFPAICHGAINAVGKLPFMVCIVNTGSMILFGPAPIGIISGIPLLILAMLLLFKTKKKSL